MDRIRIIVTDDHRLMREGLSALMAHEDDMEVIGEAANGEEAINLVRERQPDIVLMDILMPGMNGLEAARWIQEVDPHVGVIVLSMEVSKEYVTAAIKSGVDGYLPKNIGKSDLLNAVRMVSHGQRYFSEAIKKLIFEDFYLEEKLKGPKRGASGELTRREMEVLRLVAYGRTNAEIAEDLSISIKTVETHKSRVLLKLGVTNNNAVVHYAIKHNLIPT